jgi:hypothetical protein
MARKRDIAAACHTLCLWDDQWHDGRLVALELLTKGRGRQSRGEAILRVEIYPDLVNFRRRSPLHLRFVGVREVIAALNYVELADMGDDPIAFARLNETSPGIDLSAYIVGGNLRLVADDVEVIGKGKALEAQGRLVLKQRAQWRRAAAARSAPSRRVPVGAEGPLS